MHPQAIAISRWLLSRCPNVAPFCALILSCANDGIEYVPPGPGLGDLSGSGKGVRCPNVTRGGVRDLDDSKRGSAKRQRCFSVQRPRQWRVHCRLKGEPTYAAANDLAESYTSGPGGSGYPMSMRIWRADLRRVPGQKRNSTQRVSSVESQRSQQPNRATHPCCTPAAP